VLTITLKDACSLAEKGSIALSRARLFRSVSAGDVKTLCLIAGRGEELIHVDLYLSGQSPESRTLGE